MKRVFRPTHFKEYDDDPTLEMELTPAQQEMLSQAAEGELRESLQEPRKVADETPRPLAVVAPRKEPPPPIPAVEAPRPAVVAVEKTPALKDPLLKDPVPKGPVPRDPAPIPAAVATPKPIVVLTQPATKPRKIAETLSTADRPRISRVTFGLGIVGLCAFSASIAYLTIPAPVVDTPPPPAEIVPEPAKPVDEEAPPAPPDTASPSERPKVLPVRYRNPFDRSEVFEFPPGTSESEARDAVAALLLQRARQRLSPSSQAKGPATLSEDPANPARTRVARRD